MQLLIINPNTSQSVTDLIEAEAAQPPKAPGSRWPPPPSASPTSKPASKPWSAATPPPAPPPSMRAASTASVVAAFGDPAGRAQELFDVPVVGMTEAALASARLLGQRFSIIAISHRIEAGTANAWRPTA